MAVVYLARDDELERPVAIKVLAGHLADDPVFRDRFIREARLAAGLSHPNVVQIYDAGEDDGNPYIVMEYVDGRSLADELDLEERLDPARVVDLGVQVCAGLEHAHATGLVHRDIKPGNLLLNGGGTVKIADFGIARAAETHAADADGQRARHGGVPLTRAGPGRGGDRRGGHLLLRLRPLRVPHRPDALRLRDARGARGQAPGGADHAGARASARDPGGSRGGRHAQPRAESGVPPALGGGARPGARGLRSRRRHAASAAGKRRAGLGGADGAAPPPGTPRQRRAVRSTAASWSAPSSSCSWSRRSSSPSSGPGATTAPRSGALPHRGSSRSSRRATRPTTGRASPTGCVRTRASRSGSRTRARSPPTRRSRGRARRRTSRSRSRRRARPGTRRPTGSRT